jgi:hypothetical protein
MQSGRGGHKVQNVKEISLLQCAYLRSREFLLCRYALLQRTIAHTKNGSLCFEQFVLLIAQSVKRQVTHVKCFVTSSTVRYLLLDTAQQ